GKPDALDFMRPSLSSAEDRSLRLGGDALEPGNPFAQKTGDSNERSARANAGDESIDAVSELRIDLGTGRFVVSAWVGGISKLVGDVGAGGFSSDLLGALDRPGHQHRGGRPHDLSAKRFH